MASETPYFFKRLSKGGFDPKEVVEEVIKIAEACKPPRSESSLTAHEISFTDKAYWHTIKNVLGPIGSAIWLRYVEKQRIPEYKDEIGVWWPVYRYSLFSSALWAVVRSSGPEEQLRNKQRYRAQTELTGLSRREYCDWEPVTDYGCLAHFSHTVAKAARLWQNRYKAPFFVFRKKGKTDGQFTYRFGLGICQDSRLIFDITALLTYLRVFLVIDEAGSLVHSFEEKVLSWECRDKRQYLLPKGSTDSPCNPTDKRRFPSI